MTSKFNFVVCSIEEANDIEELSIDELQSSLQVHEQKINQQDKEEQALKSSIDNHFSTSSKGRGWGRGQGRGFNDRRQQQKSEDNRDNDSHVRGRGRGNYHSSTYRPRSVDKSNIECYRCHGYGHYKNECQTNLNKERGEKANFADKQEEVVSLLMACHAKEEIQQNLWYLDTGCSNHMCGNKSAFSELDESFRNIVKFGDNSSVSVMGKGNVTIQTKENSA